MSNKTIVLTGGGTAGHVSLNQAIIPALKAQGYDIHYIGSKEGIEKELIGDSFPNIPYHPISSGKLRRYLSKENISDVFKVLAGIKQAHKLIRKIKPSIIFSKGGYVSVPVVIAGKLAKVPVVIHESDVTPGLANKLATPFASHVFTVFKETLKYLPEDKATCTGSIVREQLFQGSKEKGLELCQFTEDKKVILMMGGSQGSVVINETLRGILPDLLKNYQVIHLCGKGNLDESLKDVEGYQQFEYVTDELPHLLKCADFIISRAGSNSIFEFVALEKPMLLIPLSAAKSRGDQILNAKIFKGLGFAEVLKEEEMTKDSLKKSIATLVEKEKDIIQAIQDAESPKQPEEMVKLILQYEKGK